jgi:hypothetical protein
MTTEPIDQNPRLPGPLPPAGIPVDAFNPLLRSLLSWGLVERRHDSGGHRWVLIKEAQERLELLAPRPRSSPGALAYLDHWCAQCREQKLTHLRDGRYLCEQCERAESGTLSSPSPEPKRSLRPTNIFTRRH